jgi:hypothetical protein
MPKNEPRLLAWFLMPLFLAACQAPTFDFDTPYLNDNAAKIRAVAELADLVFVGTVRGLDPAPTTWSGIVAVYQGATFEVDTVLKGFYDESTADVLHPVVAGSRTADVTPGLSPALFASGTKLIVFASPVNVFDLQSVDESFGVIPHSPQNERAVLFSM